MAMQLEFWVKDGNNGECVDITKRVQAWEILQTVEKYRNYGKHVYITLTHTSRQRGEWIIWVKRGYTSPTGPAVGEVKRMP